MNIEALQEFPPDVAPRAEESVGVWRLRYGSVNEAQSHTILTFGFIPVGIKTMYIWMRPLNVPNKISYLRAGQAVWKDFMQPRPWELVATAETAKHGRFLRWLGFIYITRDKELDLYVRPK